MTIHIQHVYPVSTPRPPRRAPPSASTPRSGRKHSKNPARLVVSFSQNPSGSGRKKQETLSQTNLHKHKSASARARLLLAVQVVLILFRDYYCGACSNGGLIAGVACLHGSPAHQPVDLCSTHIVSTRNLQTQSMPRPMCVCTCVCKRERATLLHGNTSALQILYSISATLHAIAATYLGCSPSKSARSTMLQQDRQYCNGVYVPACSGCCSGV